ncbi:MAG TPA: hypothetical protein VK824_08705 [Planctomycetota bacterium]|nr:hypothetical protein [Planctomycetota bacterium]
MRPSTTLATTVLAAFLACTSGASAELLTPVIALTPLAPAYAASGAAQAPAAWTFAADADVWQIDLSAFPGAVLVSLQLTDAFPAYPDDYDLSWDGELIGNTQSPVNGLTFLGTASPALHTLGVAYANVHTGIAPSDGGSYYNLSVQAAPGTGTAPWTNVGSGLAGIAGTPSLVGTGALAAGSAGSLALSSARPFSLALLFVSFASAPAPFKGGTLVPVPPALTIAQNTLLGSITLPWSAWPAGIPSGTSLWFQYAIQDPAAPLGAALSNALHAVTP